MIKKEFIDMLACPACKSDVEYVGDKIVCKGRDCGLAYPVKDGIPIMLIEEAITPTGKPANKKA